MTNEIYTATGCARCKIAKRYMKENDIGYDEFDFKAEGKDAFAQFYRTNRKSIFRDADGVEFPVFYDGKEIRQGVSVILGYLMSEGKLDGFIGRSLLHGEWIDGFDLSGGDPGQVDKLKEVLSYLKSSGLKVQATCSGPGANVLEQLLEAGLVDKLIMEVKGPAELYGSLTGSELNAEELSKSISLATRFPEFEVFTRLAPFERSSGEIDYLTPEEVGKTAEFIEAASGTKKNPYVLKPFDPADESDEKLKNAEPLPSSAMFKYRTQARRYQVMTEIEKT